MEKQGIEMIWETKVMQGQPDEKHLTTGALVSKKITFDVQGAVARALAFQYGLSSRTGVEWMNEALFDLGFDEVG